MNMMQVSSEKLSSFDLLMIVNDLRNDVGENSIRSNDFYNRIIDELDGEHYEAFVVQNPNNTESKGVNLTKNQALLVSMRESKAVRRGVIAKLESLSSSVRLPASFSEALQLAADQAKQLEEQAPKIEIYEKLADRTDCVTTTELAKKLGTSAIKLNEFLRERKIKFKDEDYPRAKYADWFSVKDVVIPYGIKKQCFITATGQIEITRLWVKNITK
jgi:phage antirepressor YoqD-like protein